MSKGDPWNKESRVKHTYKTLKEGMVYLKRKDYRKAAEHLMNVDAEQLPYIEDFLKNQSMEDIGVDEGDEVIVSQQKQSIPSAASIADCSFLCALATFSRHELKQRFQRSVLYQSVYEREGHLVDMVKAFVKSSFGQSLCILDNLRKRLSADPELTNHVGHLHHQINCNAYCTFLKPYERIKLFEVAKLFKTSIDNVEEDLVDMINDGLLDAGIDSIDKVYITRYTDRRADLLEKAVKLQLDLKDSVCYLEHRMQKEVDEQIKRSKG